MRPRPKGLSQVSPLESGDWAWLGLTDSTCQLAMSLPRRQNFPDSGNVNQGRVQTAEGGQGLAWPPLWPWRPFATVATWGREWMKALFPTVSECSIRWDVVTYIFIFFKRCKIIHGGRMVRLHLPLKQIPHTYWHCHYLIEMQIWLAPCTNFSLVNVADGCRAG